MFNMVNLLAKDSWPWTAIDHRVDGWPLMESTRRPLIMLLTYFGMVYMGPKLMRNRKPLDVKWVMIVYNMLIALLNLHIVIQFILGATRLNYNWFCDETKSDATDVEEMRMVTAIYLYMLTKPIEWLDTFFFIVRKKHRQLSFLHVYHHSSIFVISWMLVRWVPSGSTFFPMLLNSMVHVVMYNYYALTALDSAMMQKYFRFKRYITIIQLIQFVVSLLHGINGVVSECAYSNFPKYLIVIYAISFLILFGMFYVQTYINKSPSTIDGPIAMSKSKMEFTRLTSSQNGQSYITNKEGLHHRTMVANF